MLRDWGNSCRGQSSNRFTTLYFLWLRKIWWANVWAELAEPMPVPDETTDAPGPDTEEGHIHPDHPLLLLGRYAVLDKATQGKSS